MYMATLIQKDVVFDIKIPMEMLKCEGALDLEQELAR